MAESLSTRVGRIVSGSINALVAAVEDSAPEVVMEQAVREVDQAIDDVRGELGRVLAKKHLATTRLMEENRKHEDLSHKLEVAVAEKRDDLAEAAIARQLDIEAQIPLIERTVAECADEEKEFEGFVAALLARKREMEEELRNFLEARRAQPAASGSPAGKTGAENRAEQATSAFDRVVARHAGIGATRDGLESDKKLAELDELARGNRVRERLAAAKARLETR